MTKLPPSPDTTNVAAHMLVPEFSLDDDTIIHRGNLSNNHCQHHHHHHHHHQKNEPRLRSVAKYNAFHPQALACSNDILTTSYESSMDFGGPASLGAIAGPAGVALFRLSRPHIPLLIFSHATNYYSPSGKKDNQSRNSISSLAFQPNTTNNFRNSGNGNSKTGGSIDSNTLYLAAARGSGVLIWDSSGHSQNPLLGRLLMNDLNDSTVTAGGGRRDSDTLITSMSWMSSCTNNSNTPLLATTTASSLSMWDLRCHHTSGLFQPSLRFGSSRNANISTTSSSNVASLITSVAPIVQVACSSCSEECATIDASGIVRTYDIRKTEGDGRSSMGYPLGVFIAHEAGVGIHHMKRSHNSKYESAWVTWGLENPKSSAIVKVWGTAKSSMNTYDDSSDPIALGTNKEEYWFMGDEKLSSNNNNCDVSPSSEYQLIAQYARSNMCCARVCAAPVNNSLVVVGYLDGKSSLPSSNVASRNSCSDGWWVDLLSLSSLQSQKRNGPDEDKLYKIKGKRNFGIDQIVSFYGGAADNDVDKKSLMSVLGNADIGRLQAAELAFSSSMILRNDKSTPAATTEEGSIENEMKEIEAGMELLLCCLTDTGVLTTTSIPEALPANNSTDDKNRDSSPQRSLTRDNIIRTAFGSSASNQARVFPETKEGDSLLDVASIWGSLAGPTRSDLAVSRVDGNKIEQLRSSSPLKSAAPMEDSLRNNGRRGEGGFLPFDMDVPVPVAYTPLSAIINTSEDGAETTVRNSRSIIESIDTERVPCPRLCGAVFGSGGLVIFRNGEVKKMWNWYQKTDKIRLSSIPGGQVDVISSSDPQALITSSKDSTDLVKRYQIASSSGPRTLKELIDMTTAAKEAQWGEENNVKEDTLSVMENFFEEDSLESISDDSGNDDDDDDDEMIQNTDEIYKRYFGGRTWKGFSEMRTSMSQGTTIESNRSMLQRSMLSVGPSSDMLQPTVTITNPLNVAALDNQGILLAKGWKLGRWKIRETYSDHKFETNVLHLTPKKEKFSRTMSVPNYLSKISELPNLEESATFVKTLFIHQQEGGITFPTTLLPPPDRDMNQRVCRTGQIRTLHKSGFLSENPTGGHNLEAENILFPDLGMNNYCIQKYDRNKIYREELEEKRQLCLHNASVSKICGEVEKSSVWNLLAEIVLSQVDEDGKMYNGLGGKGGGALGVDMINNLFLYYEALQDVQMLATMFCVLSDCHHQDQMSIRPFLLPKSREKICDTYINRYGEILYSWGLLNTRAELNKHLRTYEQDVSKFMPVEEGIEEGFDLGVALSCPKCNNVVDSSRANYCQSCRDFAFRCSICDLAVRGLFTYCEICKHGGHLRHLVNWFAKNSSCPTGCGCQCIFSPMLYQEMAIGSIS